MNSISYSKKFRRLETFIYIKKTVAQGKSQAKIATPFCCQTPLLGKHVESVRGLFCLGEAGLPDYEAGVFLVLFCHGLAFSYETFLATTSHFRISG